VELKCTALIYANCYSSIEKFLFNHFLLFQGIHNKLLEDIGLPTWGSYLIFAVATIILGAILGLVSDTFYVIYNFYFIWIT